MSTMHHGDPVVATVPYSERSRPSYVDALLSRVKERLTARHDNSVYTEFTPDAPAESDVTLVQCFHGISPLHVAAADTAMRLLASCLRPRPFEWVFVEAQERKEDARFAWLADFGVDYVFVEIPPESRGIFLKEALWNTGALRTKGGKLLFLDADVVPCSMSFLLEASWGLDRWDVVSPCNWIMMANCSTEDKGWCHSHYFGLMETVGRHVRFAGDGKYGHVGLGYGMTREFYSGKLGGIDLLPRADGDTFFWRRVLGSAARPWSAYRQYGFHWPPAFYSSALTSSVGAVSVPACHVDHDSYVSRNYGGAAYAAARISSRPFEMLDYDKTSGALPKWADSPVGRIAREVHRRMREERDIYADQKDEAERFCLDETLREYGRCDNSHPLVVIATGTADATPVQDARRADDLGSAFAAFGDIPDAATVIVLGPRCRAVRPFEVPRCPDGFLWMTNYHDSGVDESGLGRLWSTDLMAMSGKVFNEIRRDVAGRTDFGFDFPDDGTFLCACAFRHGLQVRDVVNVIPHIRCRPDYEPRVGKHTYQVRIEE